MNKLFSVLALVLSISFLTAQTQQVDLTQIPEAFKTNKLELEEGSYQFNIINEGVDHEVGFVLVPKGKYETNDHIKAAYVKAPAATGQNSLTNEVKLEAGEYEYFCPLNPTPKYSLTVHEKVKTVLIEQAPGVFTTKNLELKAGMPYEFQIANVGVDHEVGFVLVPKGKYEMTDHISAAYVKSTVPTGEKSKTNVFTLEAGEYEYFCPLNPTPKYTLKVTE
jgi:uncharacterized cupredoxin-like copper-binding protein